MLYHLVCDRSIIEPVHTILRNAFHGVCQVRIFNDLTKLTRLSMIQIKLLKTFIFCFIVLCLRGIRDPCVREAACKAITAKLDRRR